MHFEAPKLPYGRQIQLANVGGGKKSDLIYYLFFSNLYIVITFLEKEIRMAKMGECQCSCHMRSSRYGENSPQVKHCMPCCESCRICHGRIRIGCMKMHLKECRKEAKIMKMRLKKCRKEGKKEK